MSMPRLTSTMWVAAYVRRCHIEGIFAVLRRKGAPEAGAIFVVLDRLDGSVALFGPAPQSESGDGDRLFEKLPPDNAADIEARLQREQKFDPDLWIVCIDDRAGRTLLETVPA